MKWVFPQQWGAHRSHTTTIPLNVCHNEELCECVCVSTYKCVLIIYSEVHDIEALSHICQVAFVTFKRRDKPVRPEKLKGCVLVNPGHHINPSCPLLKVPVSCVFKGVFFGQNCVKVCPGSVSTAARVLLFLLFPHWNVPAAQRQVGGAVLRVVLQLPAQTFAV